MTLQMLAAWAFLKSAQVFLMGLCSANCEIISQFKAGVNEYWGYPLPEVLGMGLSREENLYLICFGTVLS